MEAVQELREEIEEVINELNSLTQRVQERSIALQSGGGVDAFERFRTSRVPFQLDLERVRQAGEEIQQQQRSRTPFELDRARRHALHNIDQMWRIAAAPPEPSRRERQQTPRPQTSGRQTPRRLGPDVEDEIYI
jgi:hypothetical protein